MRTSIAAEGFFEVRAEEGAVRSKGLVGGAGASERAVMGLMTAGVS